MATRKGAMLAVLAGAGLLTTACEDPRGLGMQRGGPVAGIHTQEFPGSSYQGGYEPIYAARKPRPNEGGQLVQTLRPERYVPEAGTGGAGVGGSGFEQPLPNPLAVDRPSPITPTNREGAPSWVPHSAYPGGDKFRKNRNETEWGPAAPIPSGDDPEAPDRRIAR